MLKLSRQTRTQPGLKRCTGLKIPRRLWRGEHLSTKVARLIFEINSIHSKNRLDWEIGAAASREARAEREHRQNRLEEIRAEMQRIYNQEQDSGFFRTELLPGGRRERGG